MNQVKDSRWLVYISIFIALGLVAYSLSYYFAISNKKSNNIFYIFVAIPVLLVVLGKYRATIFLLKDIYWFFIIILFLSFLDMEQIKDAKRGGYLILLFFSCVFIDQGKGHLKNWLLLYAVSSFFVFVYAFFDWLWVWSQTGQWIRYSSWLGKSFHPGFFGMLLCFALVFLWHFHVYNKLSKNLIVQLLGLFFFVSSALICVAVFQSRTALLGFCLFFLGWIVFERKYILGIIVLALVTVLVFYLDIDQLLANRGASYRIIIWKEVVRQLFNDCNYILGCASTGDILGKFSHPHNVYLSMFYRNGLLGGGVFLVFLGCFTYLGLKHKSKWFVLSLFGWGALLTENNSLFTSPQPFWIYFWIPVFMTIVEVYKESVLKYLDNID